MNSKKVLLVSIFMCLGISLFVGGVLANQMPWQKFKKEVGVLKDINGILVTIPGEKEKDAFVKSIDPKTAMPKLKLQSYVDGQLPEQLTLKVNNHNEQLELTFNYFKQDDNIAVWAEPGIGIYVADIPNSSNKVVYYHEDLYLFDTKSMELKKLLKDEVLGYNINDLYSVYIEDHIPVWGTDPVISPDGKKIAFYSSRNAIKEIEQFRNGQLWIKDLETDEEWPIYSEGYSFLGWGKDSVYLSVAQDSIIKVDIQSGIVEKIVDFALNAAITYPYLISQPEYGTTILTNLETLESKDVKIKTLNRIGHYVKRDSSPWIAIFNYPQRTQPEQTLIIYNMESSQYAVLNAPDGTDFVTGQWSDDKLLVNIRKLASTEEETYVISLDNLVLER